LLSKGNILSGTLRRAAKLMAPTVSRTMPAGSPKPPTRVEQRRHQGIEDFVEPRLFHRIEVVRIVVRSLSFGRGLGEGIKRRRLICVCSRAALAPVPLSKGRGETLRPAIFPSKHVIGQPGVIVNATSIDMSMVTGTLSAIAACTPHHSGDEKHRQKS